MLLELYITGLAFKMMEPGCHQSYHLNELNFSAVKMLPGLVWAAGKNNRDLVSLLLSRGAKVDSGDKYGTTPLIWVIIRQLSLSLSSLILIFTDQTQHSNIIIYACVALDI